MMNPDRHRLYTDEYTPEAGVSQRRGSNYGLRGLIYGLPRLKNIEPTKLEAR